MAEISAELKIKIMAALVYKDKNGNLVTSSLIVAIAFEKRHSDVLRALDNMECSDEFRQRNFAFVENQLVGNAKDRFCVMNEYGFSFLAMGFTGKKAAKFKEEFIEAFKEMKEYIKNETNLIKLPDFTNPAESARAWADEFEAKQIAQAQVKELTPKAEVFDHIANSYNNLTMNEAAKTLKVGRNLMMEYLRGSKILLPNNTPYQEHITNGHFKVNVHPIQKGEIAENYAQTYVTSKGLTWLSKIMKESGLIKE